jgi:large subunit ribosomal protein L18
VVRKTLRGTIVQFATYEEGGDRIVATAVAKELAKFGWTRPTGNVPAAYLTGYLAGKRALAKGVQEAILDIGLHPARKGSRVFAALKGILDAGVAVPCGEDVLPADDRLRGRHLGDDVPAAVDEAKGEMEGA